MRKIVLLIFLTIFILSCNKSAKINSLYNKYESELIQGNAIKAEGYLDEIIHIDQDNQKYLKLKIPLLLNKCKNIEAIKMIDKVLKSDPQNTDLILLKILLLSDKDIQKPVLIKNLEIQLQNKMNMNIRFQS